MATSIVDARRHDFFVSLWKDANDHTKIVMNPLIAFIKDVKFEDAVARGFKWDFKIDEVSLMGYIAQVVSWLRLAMLEEPNGGFNGVDYSANKVYWFDSLKEAWAAEDTIGFEGKKLFDVLATSRDADPDSEEYKLAYKTIWRLLTSATLQKITHGKGLTHSPHCGLYLDMKENEGVDVKPGTFAELLRYGSLHFEQTRDEISYVKGVKPPPEIIIHKGLYEQ